MAAIHDLIAQVADERLRERLATEWARATRERRFGLVFEDDLPELLPLPKARPRKGDLVAPRGGPLKDLWRVRGTKDGRLQCVQPPSAGASGAADAAAAEAEFDLAEVVVREFGEKVFPALVPVDTASSGGLDAPWHTGRGTRAWRHRGLVAQPAAQALVAGASLRGGAEERPMFPDFVMVHREGDELHVDILEPHEPSRDDNVAKARALARFADRHGGHFGRIHLIGQPRAAGGARGYIDDLIQPHETRRRICRSLAMLKDKQLRNPWRKHGNIPL